MGGGADRRVVQGGLSTLPVVLLQVMAEFIPGRLGGVCRKLTVADLNAKLIELKKAENLGVFPYLAGMSKILPITEGEGNLYVISGLVNDLYMQVVNDAKPLFFG